MSLCSTCTIRRLQQTLKSYNNPCIPFQSSSINLLNLVTPTRAVRTRPYSFSSHPKSRPLQALKAVQPQPHQRLHYAWFARFRFRQRQGRGNPNEQDDAVRHNEEEAAKTAIIEKVFESRQPSDLMLRCELFLIRNECIPNILSSPKARSSTRQVRIHLH